MSAAEILLILILLIFAGFLAGTESALSSITRLFIEEQSVGKKRSARADRKSTRLNSSHVSESRMPSSA